MPDISLVIATFNRAMPLEKLLDILKRQTLERSRWEVIVAVDGSRDNTLEVLRKFDVEGSLPLRWFCQENQGQCVARHKAILKSTSSRIVIIDDDLVPCDSFLESHLLALGESARTVVLGKVLPPGDWTRRPIYELVREYDLNGRNLAFEEGRRLPGGEDLVTQNVSFYKAFYLEVGGFDPDMRLGEDTLLGMHMQRAGGKFVFSSSASAIHESNIGSCQSWIRRQYDYGKYTWLAWKKCDEELSVHPLRAFCEGSQLNRLIVILFVRSDAMVSLAVAALRVLGGLLHALHAVGLSVATHKAIIALKQHQGLRDTYGSWPALRAAEREYQAGMMRTVGAQS